MQRSEVGGRPGEAGTYNTNIKGWAQEFPIPQEKAGKNRYLPEGDAGLAFDVDHKALRKHGGGERGDPHCRVRNHHQNPL